MTHWHYVLIAYGLSALALVLELVLLAMLVMSLAAWCYSVAVVLHRARSIILVREAHTQWVHELQEHPEKS